MIVDQHELIVTVDDVQLQPLREAGTMTLDRGWSPHVQARLTVRPPDTLATTAPGETVALELTQRFADIALTRDLTTMHAGTTTADLTTAYAGGTTADLTTLVTDTAWTTPARTATGRRFELVIIGRTRSRDEHTLQLASIEALMQNWIWYDVALGEGVSVTVEAATPAALLRALLEAHDTESNFTPPTIIELATPNSLTSTSHTLEFGAPTIAYVEQQLTQLLQRMHSPGDGTLLITDSPYLHPSEIDVVHGVNLIDWEIEDEREVGKVIRFTGTATNPAARPVFSSFAFPDLNPPHEELIDAPQAYRASGGFFNSLVQEIAPFLDSRGLDESPVRLTTVNNYSVRPGTSITYTLPDEAEETDIIDAITWQLGGRFEMDIWI